MKKLLCVECRQKKKPYAPVILHVEGKVDYVCLGCWLRYDYEAFMHRVGCDCPHCLSQREFKERLHG